jgi:phosphoglycolate phosphatase-like HAD superfamily hydrolase
MTTIIFDIDGTLSDCDWRVHFVRTKPKNWAAFNKGMSLDPAYTDMVDLLKILYNAGNIILIATGRGEEFRKVTETWLKDVAGIENLYEKLYMRPAGDMRSDAIVKSELLDQMHKDGYDPVMAFDDRQQVVDMWRDRGIRCLQVAPGDF